MAERAVEDSFVAHPELPFADVRAELDVGDGAERGFLLELLDVDLEVGGQRPRRPYVRRANVDKRDLRRVGPELLAHHREPRLRVRDDRSLACLDPLLQERHGVSEVALL